MCLYALACVVKGESATPFSPDWNTLPALGGRRWGARTLLKVDAHTRRQMEANRTENASETRDTFVFTIMLRVRRVGERFTYFVYRETPQQTHTHIL